MTSFSQFCDLCGLPLRRHALALPFSDHTYRFCCNGCKQVFRMLAEKHGAKDPASFRDSELFRKCRDLGIIPNSEEGLARKTPSLETEDFDLSKGERHLPLNLRVNGMWCPACAWVIEESLKNRPGISKAACSFSSDWLRCIYDPVQVTPTQIMDSLAAMGYDAFLPEKPQGTWERRKEAVRFAVSALLTMNVMMFSFALYAGFFTEFSLEAVQSLSWPIFAMASIVVFYGGKPIYRRAWAGVTSATFGMETLITIGAFSAYLYSAFQMLSGSIHLYFDTASMLIVLVTLGKFIESRAKAKVQEDLQSLFALQPTKAKIVLPGQGVGRYVALEQLGKGDVFQVEAEEIVPADGKVTAGGATVDQSSITGEALPATKGPGDELLSGVRVIQGMLEVKAEKVPADSTLGQILKVLHETLRTAEPPHGNMDRLLKWFVPAITVLAMGTGLTCLILGLPMEEALLRSLTVLVISCPCTLGIAVPLARVAGISLAGKKGIVVHDFSSFEQADTLDTIVFDKTGTVTQGHWKLLKIISTAAMTEEQALALAASVEKGSENFIAVELVTNARRAGLQLVEPTRIATFDNGISGCIEGREVRLGSREFLQAEISAFLPARGDIFSLDPGPAHSRVFMSVNGELAGVFVFGDKIKKNAARIIGELRARNYRLYLVSGDGDEATRTIAQEAGIEQFRGGLLPAGKVAFVGALQNQGRRVAMVGDGFNDAPALAMADLGMGIASGTGLAKQTRGISLIRGDLNQILDFLTLAGKVNKKISRNLLFSGLYNAIAIPVAMTGLLNPLIAVSAMLLSSLTVIGNTVLLIKRNH